MLYRIWAIIVAMGLAVLLAGIARADNEWSNCSGETGGFRGATVRGARDCIQYRFNDTQSTNDFQFLVAGSSALVSFVPDASAASGTATVMIQHCVEGYTAASTTCSDILAAPLTGAGGDSSTQRHSVRVGPGYYNVDVQVAATSGDTAVLQVRGEE